MERRTHDGANTETETVIPYGTNDLNPAEVVDILSELCIRLKLKVVRTNATKHGNVEMHIEDDAPPPPPSVATLADAQAEIARLRAALSVCQQALAKIHEAESEVFDDDLQENVKVAMDEEEMVEIARQALESTL